MNTKNTSKKEKENLEKRQIELKEKSYRLGNLCVGTIQERFLPCGKPNCQCKKKNGKKHGPYYYLSFTGRENDKRMVAITLSKEDVSGIKERIENFKKLEDEIRELLKIEFKINKNLKKTSMK
jgi:hypothetical protein